MALPQQFQVGDRVRTRRKIGDVPKGSIGTIVRVFAAVECSDVRFDAYPGLRLISHNDLRLAEQEAESGQS